MKQIVSETESNWGKNAKTCLQNKKSYLMLSSRHSHFHPILILPVKMVVIILCENQSFFLSLKNVANFIESHFVYLCYFFQYDEVFLISLFDACYHYLVFMDPVNGYSKLKLLLKE